jgi:hypothetical protein
MFVIAAVIIASFVLTADYAWASYRDWRRRRLALKHGRTLTQKFFLPR